MELRAIIARDGTIEHLEVLSGPPLLIQAAINALGQWKYEPTYLNDEPVPVAMSVSVTFQLSQ